MTIFKFRTFFRVSADFNNFVASGSVSQLCFSLLGAVCSGFDFLFFTVLQLLCVKEPWKDGEKNMFSVVFVVAVAVFSREGESTRPVLAQAAEARGPFYWFPGAAGRGRRELRGFEQHRLRHLQWTSWNCLEAHGLPPAWWLPAASSPSSPKPPGKWTSWCSRPAARPAPPWIGMSSLG